jgi:hypothetical protein
LTYNNSLQPNSAGSRSEDLITQQLAESERQYPNSQKEYCGASPIVIRTQHIPLLNLAEHPVQLVEIERNNRKCIQYWHLLQKSVRLAFVPKLSWLLLSPISQKFKPVFNTGGRC